MSEHHPLRELLEKMPPEDRAIVKAMADEMRAEIRSGTARDREGDPDPYDVERAESSLTRQLRENGPGYAPGSDHERA